MRRLLPAKSSSPGNWCATRLRAGFRAKRARNGWPVWHGFGWISDLVAGGAAARDAARELVQSWLTQEIAYHSVAWRSDVLATRLFAWISHFDEIVGGGQHPALKRAMLESLAAQNRHLARIAAWELEGPRGCAR